MGGCTGNPHASVVPARWSLPGGQRRHVYNSQGRHDHAFQRGRVSGEYGLGTGGGPAVAGRTVQGIPLRWGMPCSRSRKSGSSAQSCASACAQAPERPPSPSGTSGSHHPCGTRTSPSGMSSRTVTRMRHPPWRVSTSAHPPSSSPAPAASAAVMNMRGSGQRRRSASMWRCPVWKKASSRSPVKRRSG